MTAHLLRAIICVCLVAIATRSEAEITSLLPATPTSQDVIRVTISYQNIGCVAGASTVIAGSTIRTEISLRGCAYLPPVTGTIEERFGPIPPGTYTYEVYTELAGATILNDRRTLVVAEAPAPVPALGGTASVLLLVVICAVAMLRLK